MPPIKEIIASSEPVGLKVVCDLDFKKIIILVCDNRKTSLCIFYAFLNMFFKDNQTDTLDGLTPWDPWGVRLQ